MAEKELELANRLRDRLIKLKSALQLENRDIVKRGEESFPESR